MLCVFLLRRFFVGVSFAAALMYATSRFREYMHEKERDLMRLPLEVATYLDHSDDSEISQPVFQFHVAHELHSKAQFIQPSLIAEPNLWPDTSAARPLSAGLWSTDPLHGGICRWAVRLGSFVAGTLCRWLRSASSRCSRESDCVELTDSVQPP